MATHLENIEYLALLKCKVALTSEISEDPLSIATALMDRGLIPESLHSSVLQQTKDNEVKASELVNKVTNKIKTYPARFADFLEVLQGSNWLKDVLKSLTTAYDELKAENKKGSDTEDVKTTSTKGIRMQTYMSNVVIALSYVSLANQNLYLTVKVGYDLVIRTKNY